MRNMTIMLMSVLFITTGMSSPVQAETATWEEAFTVAENWIALIIEEEGTWGGAETAYVSEVQDFKGGERLLGYYCGVWPQGYVLVSLHKELTPVKAYSTTDALDVTSDAGLIAVLKMKMEQASDSLFAPGTDGDAALRVLSVSRAREECRLAWNALMTTQRDSDLTMAADCDCDGMQITGSKGPLLTSNWHQGRPYNYQCPWSMFLNCDGPCPPNDPHCILQHCAVGCTATAGAQVMRYWAWPPSGLGGHDGLSYEDSYDWAHMADEYKWDSFGDDRWEDGKGNPLSDIFIDAVSELCREIGAAVGMEYCSNGTCMSAAPLSTWGKDLLDAFEDHFQYDDEGDDYNRNDYSAVGWFNLIKEQLTLNRPIPYGIKGEHTFVCDGWRECSVGAGVVCRQYHMNYGWSDTQGDTRSCPEWADFSHSNTWYTLDDLPCSTIDKEELLVAIYPDCAQGSSLSSYSSPWGGVWVYFDQDATPFLFSPGTDPIRYQADCQFLPGVRVGSAGPSEILASKKNVEFAPSAFGTSKLFSIKGTSTASIKIMNKGLLRLSNGGKIRFF
jgi:hypothetical protein